MHQYKTYINYDLYFFLIFLAYTKHSNARGSSRIRWPHDSDIPPSASSSSSHRRRHETENPDMDISPGDSTPTSEASYSHSSTPTAIPQNEGPVLLSAALPRLASHPSTPTNSQLHFTTPSSVSLNTTSSVASASCGGSSLNQHPHQQQQQHHQNSGNNIGIVPAQQHQISKLVKSDSGNNAGNSGIHSSGVAPVVSSPSTTGVLGGNNISNSAGQSETMINSNTPGPPSVTLASLPKILSQITGNKTIDQNELNPQKALQTINTALMMSSRQQISGNNNCNVVSGNDSNHTNSASNSLR